MIWKTSDSLVPLYWWKNFTTLEGNHMRNKKFLEPLSLFASRIDGNFKIYGLYQTFRKYELSQSTQSLLRESPLGQVKNRFWNYNKKICPSIIIRRTIPTNSILPWYSYFWNSRTQVTVLILKNLAFNQKQKRKHL